MTTTPNKNPMSDSAVFIMTGKIIDWEKYGRISENLSVSKNQPIYPSHNIFPSKVYHSLSCNVHKQQT